MNYRHAFHAGNFADVMKHALLARILAHLLRKPAPFRVVDTHAGIAVYDLAGSEAERTGEARDGIGRLDAPFAPDVEALLAPYRAILAGTRARHGPVSYPGSPAIVAASLRPDDRAILVEKHPEDAALLARRFARSRTMKVLALDGWTALRSTVPPRERRGLVLIDPPYEEPGELARAADRLAEAQRRWPTGVFALWYPVKDDAEAGRWARGLAARLNVDAIRLEMAVAPPRPLGPLVASGLVVLNPPWTLLDEARLLLPALAERLGRDGPGSSLCETLAGG